MIDRRRQLAVAAGGTVTVLVATALMSPHSGGVVATTSPVRTTRAGVEDQPNDSEQGEPRGDDPPEPDD